MRWAYILLNAHAAFVPRHVRFFARQQVAERTKLGRRRHHHELRKRRRDGRRVRRQEECRFCGRLRDPRSDKKPAPPCRSLRPRFRCAFCGRREREREIESGGRASEFRISPRASAQCCRKKFINASTAPHASRRRKSLTPSNPDSDRGQSALQVGQRCGRLARG